MDGDANPAKSARTHEVREVAHTLIEPVGALLSIGEVSRRAGVSVRTLRYYHEIGLLNPCSVGSGGVRFYGPEEAVRLHNIVLLRGLGLGLDAIVVALEASEPLDLLKKHRQLLASRLEVVSEQIARVDRLIDHISKGAQLMAEEAFSGIDHDQYQDEVESRWGKDAWAQGQKWWKSIGDEGQQQFLSEHAAIAQDWQELHASHSEPGSPEAQDVAKRHHAWLTKAWQGKAPDAEQLVGLGEMYASDPRFAKNYGGELGAAYVRDALAIFAQQMPD